MTQTEFYMAVLERMDELNEQLERMSPSHMDTMTGMSLIDAELMKAEMLRRIAEALDKK